MYKPTYPVGTGTLPEAAGLHSDDRSEAAAWRVGHLLHGAWSLPVRGEAAVGRQGGEGEEGGGEGSKGHHLPAGGGSSPHGQAQVWRGRREKEVLYWRLVHLSWEYGG